MSLSNSARVIVLGLVLSGCQSLEKGNSQTTETARDPLYMKLSDADIKLADQAVQEALEKNLSLDPLSWKNPQTGHQGVIVPIRTYRSEYGTFCRNYKETVIVGSKREIYSDTACRNPRGVWIPI
ncbi:RT0821/Lpp0805 family surface protein [Motiliproteus sediminis]|uniref:RT0821/Lpp0805 family surface protein n=1 Tax=Motiliproteus sediminis TaxID=1468178 RepID=UPI001AEF950F|nr:RT0821/Lpp0805 family surface protein [Motiliproteus sediminis]